MISLVLIFISLSAVSAAENTTEMQAMPSDDMPLEITDDVQNDTNAADEVKTEDIENSSEKDNAPTEDVLSVSPADDVLGAKTKLDMRVIFSESNYYDQLNFEYGLSNPKFIVRTYYQIDINDLKVYIDNKKVTLYKVPYYYDKYDFDVSYLKIGNHSLYINYVGDSKFSAEKYHANFEIYTKINGCTSYLNAESEEPYSLKLPDDANGSLVLYLDGVKCRESKLINGFAKIETKDLNPGIYNLTVLYTGNDYPVNPINVSNFKIEPRVSLTTSGIGKATLNFLFNETPHGTLTITDFDTGKKLATLTNLNKTMKVNLNLNSFSSYLSIKYEGSGYNFTAYKTVDFKRYVKYSYSLKIGPGSTFNLNLGTKSSGTVSVYTVLWEGDGSSEGSFYRCEIGSAKYSNGKAQVQLDGLCGGEHKLFFIIRDDTYGSYANIMLPNDWDLTYEGGDDVYIKPKMIVPSSITQSGTIYFELYKAKGIVNVYVDGVKYTSVAVKNSHAKINLANLGNGQHVVQVKFVGTGKNMDKKFHDKIAFGMYDLLPRYINYYKVYSKVFKVTAKQSIALYKTNIKKSSKYITLSAKLTQKQKNQKITFTIKGKTFTARTNEKGIATVKIPTKKIYSKLVVGKRASYSATYLKDTAKMAVIVKK